GEGPGGAALPAPRFPPGVSGGDAPPLPGIPQARGPAPETPPHPPAAPGGEGGPAGPVEVGGLAPAGTDDGAGPDEHGGGHSAAGQGHPDHALPLATYQLEFVAQWDDVRRRPRPG